MSRCQYATGIETRLDMFQNNKPTDERLQLKSHMDRLPSAAADLGSLEHCNSTVCPNVGTCVPHGFEKLRPAGVHIPQKLEYNQEESEDVCVSKCLGRRDCNGLLIAQGMCKTDQNKDQGECAEGDWLPGTHCALLKSMIPQHVVEDLPDGRIHLYTTKPTA